jgi:hypothetical protein
MRKTRRNGSTAWADNGMSAEKSSPVSAASAAPQERLGELLGRIGAEGLHELEDLARPLSAESLHHVGGQVVDRRRGARGGAPAVASERGTAEIGSGRTVLR